MSYKDYSPWEGEGLYRKVKKMEKNVPIIAGKEDADFAWAHFSLKADPVL